MQKNGNNRTTIIKIFLMTVFIISMLIFLGTGKKTAERNTAYRLEGITEATVSADTVKNSCINLFSVLK